MPYSLKGYIAATGVCLATGLVWPAQAQVETVTVTAIQPPPAVGSAAFSTVTLSADQLSQDDRLDDALEQVPGLSLFRRSGSENANATTQGVSLRAIAPSGAGRALVTLDGVPMNDPFGGWVIWGALPSEDIGGAQVVRGAGAGPYGSGALTGTISLFERDNTNGIAVADASGGSLDTARLGASGGIEDGDFSLFASATGERSNGWIPVDPPRRGVADNHLWLDSGEASVRAEEDLPGNIVAAARFETYADARGAGLQGANSDAQGDIASLTLAKPATTQSFGWRLQAWAIDSFFTNISVSVPAFPLPRTGATPANDQYSIPALGYGFNAAAIGASGDFHWEVGADERIDSGQSHEFFAWDGADYSMSRVSGGMETVGGLYAEGAYDTGAWLATLGLRGDYWSTAQGHLAQSLRVPSTPEFYNDYPGRDGVLPTARAGLRRNFSNGWLDGDYIRVAAYEGFRVPTLNELYRPFRVGNNTTDANPALEPEKLYGAEMGVGGARGAFTWDATSFWNQLHDAVTNVTIASSPLGITYMRENAGDIDALGFEGDAAYKLSDAFSLRAAISLTDARVHQNPASVPLGEPSLTGNRPAQAPTTTITSGLTWLPWEPLRLDADLHWESSRFEDDQNTMKLGAAFVLDTRATWTFADALSAYVAVNNVTDTNIATAEAADGTISYGQPRMYEVGVTYAP
jgi:outer membrane receptor protein involved in Fe transport